MFLIESIINLRIKIQQKIQIGKLKFSRVLLVNEEQEKQGFLHEHKNATTFILLIYFVKTLMQNKLNMITKNRIFYLISNKYLDKYIEEKDHNHKSLQLTKVYKQITFMTAVNHLDI